MFWRALVNRIDNFELTLHYSRNTPTGGICILVRLSITALEWKDICQLVSELVFECFCIELANKSEA